MPEGDTIFRAARTLHQVFAGKVVTRFEAVFPALTRVAEDRPIVGRTIQSIAARGKHLLFTLSGDLVLRTHMRMNGIWHIYPIDARWKRPARDMRVLVGTIDAVAVAFNVYDAEFLTSRALARHKTLGALGPDLLDPSFEAEEALRRMRHRGDASIADVLLDQRVLAGIGNVFKSEILFLAALNPWAPTSSLSDDELRRLIASAVDALRANVLTPEQTLRPAFGRRTTMMHRGGPPGLLLDPRAALWVYGRRNRPCRRCGTPIASRQTGIDARRTYWCPRCQDQRAEGGATTSRTRAL